MMSKIRSVWEEQESVARALFNGPAGQLSGMNLKKERQGTTLPSSTQM